MPKIPYLLIRNVDPATYNRLRKLARVQRKPLSLIAGDLLKRYFSQQSSQGVTDRSMITSAHKPRIKVRRI